MRELVVQSIITVGQDASVELEARTTGLLSTSLLHPDGTSEWGDVLAHGVLAAIHQHLFDVRIDPIIDVPRSTVMQEGSVSLRSPTPGIPTAMPGSWPRHPLCAPDTRTPRPLRNAASRSPTTAGPNPSPGNSSDTNPSRGRATFANRGCVAGWGGAEDGWWRGGLSWGRRGVIGSATGIQLDGQTWDGKQARYIKSMKAFPGTRAVKKYELCLPRQRIVRQCETVPSADVRQSDTAPAPSSM